MIGTPARTARSLMVAALVAVVWTMCLGLGASGAASSLVGTLALPGESIAVAAALHTAYVLTSEGDGLHLNVVSVVEPTHPVLRSSVPIDGSVSRDVGVFACTDWVLVWITAGGARVVAVDVRDPEAPVVGGRIACDAALCSGWPGTPEGFPPTVLPAVPAEVASNTMRSERLVFRADGEDVEVCELGSDLRGTSRGPQRLATPGDAGDVWVVDDLLFVADGQDVGLTVMRTEYPSSDGSGFVRATRWISTSTPGAALAVAVSGDLALVADGEKGVAILALAPLAETGRDAPLAAPVFVESVDTPGIATDVAVLGDLALVADGPQGLQVVRLGEAGSARETASFEARVVDVSPATAGASANYSILLRTDNPLRADTDTIVVRFPAGVSFVATPRTPPTPLDLIPGPDEVAPDALPDHSVSIQVGDSEPVSFPAINTVTGDSTVGDARWNAETGELTLTLPRDVGAGETMLLAIDRAACITTPPEGTRYVLHLATSQHPLPAATINSFSIGPSDWLAALVRMMSVTPDTELQSASCVVAFATSSVGNLAAGDSVRVTFPPGAAIAAGGVCTPIHIQVGAAAPVLVAGAVCAAPVPPEGPTITIPVAAPIPANTRVTLYFGRAIGLVNPAHGTNYTVSVATTADPVPIPSDPYTIRPLPCCGTAPDADRPRDGVPEKIQVRNIRSPYEGYRSQYDVYLTTSPSGALSGDHGDTITVTFPYGTSLSEGGYEAAARLNGVSLLAHGLDSILKIVVPIGVEIAAGETVVLSFSDVINPPAGTAYAIAVHTSADTQDAMSDPYDIVAAPIGADALATLTEKLDELLALLEEDAVREQDAIDCLCAELDLLGDALDSLSIDLVDRLDEVLTELATQTEIGEDALAVLHEIRDCLGSLSFSGTAIPPAEREPVYVVLCIDDSGSMADNDPGGDRESGALELLSQLDRATDFVGVVTWSDGVNLTTGLTHDFDNVRATLGGLRNDGGTDFDAGLRAAVEMLDGVSGEGNKVIVFLTDGDPGTYTEPGSSGSWVDRARAAGIRIYAIGLGELYAEAAVQARLERMASATNGASFHARQGSDLSRVYSEIASALAGPWQIELVGSCSGEAPATASGTAHLPWPVSAVSLPFGADLELSVAYERHYFSFELAAGATVVIDIDASAGGSALDPFICLFNADGHEIACDDDTHGYDPYLEETLSSGVYYVMVRGYGDTTGFYTINIVFGSP